MEKPLGAGCVLPPRVSTIETGKPRRKAPKKIPARFTIEPEKSFSACPGTDGEKEGKVETFERNIIFSQKFPDAYPEAILKKAEELYRAAPASRKKPPPPFEELLKQIEENNTYELRPDGARKSNTFVSLAIAVCREFEIDTEITKGKYEINVTMDLGYGWYGGDFKRPLIAVLKLADDFHLTCNKNRPDCVRISMTYHTHNRYVCGKRADW